MKTPKLFTCFLIACLLISCNNITIDDQDDFKYLTTWKSEFYNYLDRKIYHFKSKLACENIVQEYCAFYRIPFVINRCGLLSGSGQLYKNDQGIISYWINSWKKRKKLNYIGFGGKGTQARDCLHPLDLSKLIKKQINFLERKKLKNFIFNVSGGISSSFSLRELSIWCEKKIFLKKIGYNKKNRPFDLKWIILDSTKAKRIFKWKPEFSKYDIFQDINSNDR